MSRKQPTKSEHDALRVWIELAEIKDGDPVPGHVLEELRSIARAISRLALPWGLVTVPAKQAAAQAAATAGLTGRAIAGFRAEQVALKTEMMFRFNRGQPTPDKSSVIADSITNVGERQVYKRLKRSR